MGEDHLLTVATSHQRTGIHAAVQRLARQVQPLAGNLLLPDPLAVQRVQLDEVAGALVALLIHLAGSVEVRRALLLATHHRAVGVVVVIVVPHRPHGVQVDAQDVSVIVREEAVVTIHAEARLNAGCRPAYTVTHHADALQRTLLPLVLVETAVLARPEEVAACHDGRRVKGVPSAPCLRVGTVEERPLMLQQVEHLTAEGPWLAGHPLSHVQVHQFRVHGHRALHHVP